MEELSEGRGCERVLRVTSPAGETLAFTAVHSTRLGPAFGGIRRRRFESEADAIAEVVELATAMSHKCALAGLPAGGAKTVILDRDGLDAADAYRAVGAVVRELGGAYVCGPDVGTGAAELDLVRQETEHVNPAGNDAGVSTARGVLAGLRGVLRALDGRSSFGNRSYLVQGLGAVGLEIARVLLGDGARVLGTDVSDAALARAREAGVEVVPSGAASGTVCDVWLPCALGHVLDVGVAERVPVRAICGSANNQLHDDRAAGVLHRRGILHAPDVVVSAGAVIEGVLTVLAPGPDVRERVARTIDAIEDTVARVLAAARGDRTPTEVAGAMARARIG